MASPRSIIATGFRWATWPLLVIVALNIENRATDAGYSKISLRTLFGSDNMTDLYGALTSNWVWGSALFLAGAVTFAWLYEWAERSDKKQGRWARLALAAECESVARALESPGITRSVGMQHRRVPILNKRLILFGFEPIASFDPNNEEANKRSARYLRSIQGPIQSGDLEHAREIGAAVLKLEKAKTRRLARKTA